MASRNRPRLPLTLPESLRLLLRTNNPPSSPDATVIAEWTLLLDSFLTQLETALAGATTSFDSATSDLIEGRERAVELRRLHDQLRLLASPVRRLPCEILQEIFLQIDDELVVFDLDDTHYVVGQVCHKWRVASHSFPRMWSRFVIIDPPYNPEARVRRLLRRAGNVPLDFVILKTLFEPVECCELFSSLLALLMEHSLNWESVSINGLSMSEALFLSAIRGRVPKLRSLRMKIEPGYPAYDLPHRGIIRALEIAPRLAHLELYNIPFGHISLDATVNRQMKTFAVFESWSDEEEENLERETFYIHGSSSLLDTLRRFPNLTSVDVRCTSEGKDNFWLGPPPAEIPRDVYASVTSLHTVEPDSLYMISLPNLTELGVGFLVDAAEVPMLRSTISLIRHSRCRLSTLSLGHGALGYVSLCELFEVTPVLQSLCVSYRKDTDANDILQDVTSCLGAVDFRASVFEFGYKYVPMMRTLKITATMVDWTFVDVEFLNMVAGRRRETGLQEVVLICPLRGTKRFPNLTRSEGARLREMVEDGVITLSGVRWVTARI